MAAPLISIMESVGRKISLLQARKEELEEKISRLEADMQDMQASLRETRAKLDKAMLDNEFLAVSHKLADNPDTLVAARRRIARLIRTIDTCIAMLKE